MRVLRTVLQGFQNNMGWSVTELSSGDVAIFNGYNGVLYIVALQIVNDDLAVGAKLGCKTAGKACIKSIAVCPWFSPFKKQISSSYNLFDAVFIITTTDTECKKKLKKLIYTRRYINAAYRKR